MKRERIDTIQWKSYIYKKHWAKQKKLLMVIRGYPNDDFYDGFDDEGNKRYNNPEGERTIGYK